jgi:hypothetical protein
MLMRFFFSAAGLSILLAGPPVMAQSELLAVTGQVRQSLALSRTDLLA